MSAEFTYQDAILLYSYLTPLDRSKDFSNGDITLDRFRKEYMNVISDTDIDETFFITPNRIPSDRAKDAVHYTMKKFFSMFTEDKDQELVSLYNLDTGTYVKPSKKDLNVFKYRLSHTFFYCSQLSSRPNITKSKQKCKPVFQAKWIPTRISKNKKSNRWEYIAPPRATISILKSRDKSKKCDAITKYDSKAKKEWLNSVEIGKISLITLANMLKGACSTIIKNKQINADVLFKKSDYCEYFRFLLDIVLDRFISENEEYKKYTLSLYLYGSDAEKGQLRDDKIEELIVELPSDESESESELESDEDVEDIEIDYIKEDVIELLSNLGLKKEFIFKVPDGYENLIYADIHSDNIIDNLTKLLTKNRNISKSSDRISKLTKKLVDSSVGVEKRKDGIYSTFGISGNKKSFEINAYNYLLSKRHIVYLLVEYSFSSVKFKTDDYEDISISWINDRSENRLNRGIITFGSNILSNQSIRDQLVNYFDQKNIYEIINFNFPKLKIKLKETFDVNIVCKTSMNEDTTINMIIEGIFINNQDILNTSIDGESSYVSYEPLNQKVRDVFNIYQAYAYLNSNEIMIDFGKIKTNVLKDQLLLILKDSLSNYIINVDDNEMLTIINY